MVKQVNLIGAEKVSADELKALMITKEGNYLAFLTGEGTYREEAFQRDLAVIEAAYYDRGFINVKVEKPTVAHLARQAAHLHLGQDRRGRAVPHREHRLLRRPDRPQGEAATR